MPAKEIQTLEYNGMSGSKEKEFWSVGQKVIFRGAMGAVSVKTIDRITDGRGGTIYIGKDAFDATGSLRGGGTWSQTHIEPATEVEILKIRASIIKRKLKDFDWRTISDEDASTIIAYIRANHPKLDFEAGKVVEP